MRNNDYELIVLVNGKPVREYPHDGRIFVEGRPNSTYSIKLKNNSYKRVLAIVSVDGINVISGEPAEDEGPGYVIDARSSSTIKGFRQDLETVGEFKFCKSGKSYCNSAGKPGNNGVIGVMMVEEAPKPKPNVIYRSKSSDVRCFTYDSNTTDCSYTTTVSDGSEYGDLSVPLMASAGPTTPEPEPSFSVGTTWGKEVQDSATMVEFKPGTYSTTFELYYGTKSDLKKMGVPLEKKSSKVGFPSAFGKFAKPPKGWTGK